MKTKREVLKSIIKVGSCKYIDCTECPYNDIHCHDVFFKIGAMAILRQNRKKREFDPDKILTCVTADKAKVGMKGYFADTLLSLRSRVENNEQISELIEILDEASMCRFKNNEHIKYFLFYPIDEIEK